MMNSSQENGSSFSPGDRVEDVDLSAHQNAKSKDNPDKIEPSSSKAGAFSQKWTHLINSLRNPIRRVLLAITNHAAFHPKAYITGVIGLSLIFVLAGILTNFTVDVNEDTLWTPMGSRPLQHGEWIDNESGFPAEPRNFLLLIHRSGGNVLGQEGVERCFDALETLRSTEGYEQLCKGTGHTDFNSIETCLVYGATNVWNDTRAFFEANVSSDEEAIMSLSSPVFPNGAPVDAGSIFGKVIRGEDGVLESAESFSFVVQLPGQDVKEDLAKEVEERALETLLNLHDMWLNEEGNDFVLQVFAERSFSDEFTRAIVNDIPLVPIVFVIMGVFTCLVFFRRDWVYSRTMLGLGAVVTVLLAIMTGYGIMFMAGVPFTSMTQILPFIMFGIGLDNAFIISGEYARTDKNKTAEERIHDTIHEVGLSIFLTTTTSVVAFALGCTSSIPAVFWLCQYGAPTIAINFFYQLTFFVALIIIDERRVADKRRDWIFCSTVKSRVGSSEVEEGPQESWFDRFMGWYADFLFNPLVSAFVLIAFAALLAVCAYSTSKLTQDFQFTDVVPKDSYVADFWGDFTEHSEQTGVAPGVYFRFVDQCDPAMQQQMEDYINDLVAMKEVNDQPFYFWLRDFKSFVNKTLDVQDLECKDQIAAFLEEPVYYDLYNRHIIMADNGEVISSRTSIRMDNVDQERVTEQVDALENQRSVSRSQPINRDRKDWAFFTWDGLYYIWEFYAVSPRELAQTTIAGVVAVSVIGMIFIPHWSAVIFVTPMISVLYVDLLGVLQFAGIHVNAVSYVSLIMSIGLLVDFLMHILLRFYESRGENRKAKVKDTLQTMGSSILVGAISTFLGVIPLAFSSSEIFNTIFVTFIGLVTLGAGHGLILFPVILSLIGPEVCTEENSQNPQKEVDNKKTLENFETTCPVDDGSESDSNIEYEV